jgi:hypothetical protein
VQLTQTSRSRRASEMRGREEVSDFTCIERKCLIAASP